MQKKLQTTISIVTTVACLIGLGLLPASAMQDNDPAIRQDNELEILKAQIKQRTCREHVVQSRVLQQSLNVLDEAIWLLHTYTGPKGQLSTWEVKIGETRNGGTLKTKIVTMNCPNCARVAILYEKLQRSFSK